MTQDAQQHDTRVLEVEPDDTRVLRVYVASHCDACHESRRLARVVAVRLPGVIVELVDVDRETAPDEIFAVPTFWYRGQIISLGNPAEDDLCQRIVNAERTLSGLSLPVLEARPTHNEGKRPSFSTLLGHHDVVAMACGGAGLAGTALCAASMVAVVAGVFAAHLHARSQGTAGLIHAPGFLAATIRLGPAILILSILLVVTSAAARQPTGILPAVLGGSILYLGMYAQSMADVRYSAMVVGLILLALAYMLVLSPDRVSGFRVLRL